MHVLVAVLDSSDLRARSGDLRRRELLLSGLLLLQSLLWLLEHLLAAGLVCLHRRLSGLWLLCLGRGLARELLRVLLGRLLLWLLLDGLLL